MSDFEHNGNRRMFWGRFYNVLWDGNFEIFTSRDRPWSVPDFAFVMIIHTPIFNHDERNQCLVKVESENALSSTTNFVGQFWIGKDPLKLQPHFSPNVLSLASITAPMAKNQDFIRSCEWDSLQQKCFELK